MDLQLFQQSDAVTPDSLALCMRRTSRLKLGSWLDALSFTKHRRTAVG